MAMKRISDAEGLASWDRWLHARSGDQDAAASRGEEATAVRYALQMLEELAPGSSVEVRVIPFGAVQVVEGATHRRGTPPAVVEMNASVWLELASGLANWQEAVDDGRVDASGERADLGRLLPLRSVER